MAKSRVTNEADSEPAAPKRGKKGARASAKRWRGRSLFALVLIAFVLVASAVIWRRSYGITHARALVQLDRRRIQLESERSQLEALIRDESGRAKLAPALGRLGMQVPSDQQVRILPR